MNDLIIPWRGEMKKEPIMIDINVFDNNFKTKKQQNELLKSMSLNRVEVIITEPKEVMRFTKPKDLLSHFTALDRDKNK